MLRHALRNAAVGAKSIKSISPMTVVAINKVPVASFSAQRPRILEDAPQNGTSTVDGKTRPISPDLAIWRFDIPTYMHVGHRISGVALSVGFTGIGLYGLTNCDIPTALESFKTAAPILVPVAKFSVAFPLAYHLVMGWRQLYHDFTAKGLNAEFQEKSAYVLGATALLIALIAAFYSY